MKTWINTLIFFLKRNTNQVHIESCVLKGKPKPWVSYLRPPVTSHFTSYNNTSTQPLIDPRQQTPPSQGKRLARLWCPFLLLWSPTLLLRYKVLTRFGGTSWRLFIGQDAARMCCFVGNSRSLGGIMTGFKMQCLGWKWWERLAGH